LHLLNFIEEFFAMIWLNVIVFNPKITCNNTSVITKEPGIKEDFNYRVIVCSKSEK